MEIVLLVLLAVAASYVTAAPDRTTASIRGGAAGAIRSGVRTAGRSIGSDWRTFTSDRIARNKAKQDQRRTEWGPVRLWLEKVFGSGGAVESGAKSVRNGLVAGCRSAKEGWRAGQAGAHTGLPKPIQDRIKGHRERQATCQTCGQPTDRHRMCTNYDCEDGPVRNPDAYRVGIVNPKLKCLKCGTRFKAYPCPTCHPDGDDSRTGPGPSLTDELLGAPDQKTTGPDSPAGDVQEEDMANGTNVLGAGELTDTGVLRAELKEGDSMVEGLQSELKQLTSWMNQLSDRYAAAKFSSDRLTAGVGGLSEHAQNAQAAEKGLAQVREIITNLNRACDEADQFGEHGQTMGAKGDAEAFQSA